MNQTDLTAALELGFIGLVLIILALPILLMVLAWRALTQHDY